MGEPRERCGGCGQIANSPDGESWTVWTSLPPGSDIAVKIGLVRPIPCPECGGVLVQRAAGNREGIVADRAKTVSLLDAWLLEDARATEDSLEGLKSGLDGHRESSRKLFPRGGDDV